MKKGVLTFVCGLPRSGKSTYCDHWVRFRDPFSLQDTGYPFTRGNPRVIIAGDDYRKALHGMPYWLEAEGTVFAMMDVSIRAQLLRGVDVIVDETCTTEQTLLRYLRLDINASPVFVNTPADVCVKRALALGQDYLVKPIQFMDRQLKALRADWDKTYRRLQDHVRERYVTG